MSNIYIARNNNFPHLRNLTDLYDDVKLNFTGHRNGA